MLLRPLIVFTILLLATFLAPPPADAARGILVPEISVQILELVEEGPVAGVSVELLVRRGRGDDLAPVASATTRRDGRTVFASSVAEEIRSVVLRFSWDVPDRPRRNLLYELRAKKGPKTADGRLMRPGNAEAPYVLASGETAGDCENLFRRQDSDDAIVVVFLRPPSYADCDDTHVKHARLAEIGQRDINGGALNLYSFGQDVEMGRQFVQGMGPEQPILDDPLVAGYVTDLIRRLGRVSDMPELEYQVQVIDADVMNAFALPGGYVFVYRGLIEAAETESELVGVLAHEIAHVTGRHGTEGMTSAMAKMASAMLLGSLAAEEITEDETVQQLILGAVMQGTNLWVLGGGRKREAEADRLGSQYAIRAGYDPRGLATFFDKLSKAKGGGRTRLDTLFSSHPRDEVRVENVHEMMDYFLPPADDLITSSPAFAKVKKRLASLPPPRMAGETAANALMSAFQKNNERLMWGAFLEYLETEEAPRDGGS